MCIEATHFLSKDMKCAFEQRCRKEESPLGKQVLESLEENLEIAGNDMIPICQDTGMAGNIYRAWPGCAYCWRFSRSGGQ